MIEQPMISEIKKAEDDGELVVVSKEEIADAEEVDDCEDEDELEVKINPVCDEHSRAMYICDLLIGDVFICQGLAGNKLQAKSCAARKVCYVMPLLLVLLCFHVRFQDHLVFLFRPSPFYPGRTSSLVVSESGTVTSKTSSLSTTSPFALVPRRIRCPF